MSGSKQLCALCNTSNRQTKGGSLASDSVVNLVSCDTFEQMSQLSTNSFGGAAKRSKKRTSSQRKPKNKQRGGASDCSDCVDTNISLMDSYTIGPATVPGGLPATNQGFVDYSSVQGSVLTSLSQTPPTVLDTYQSVIIPQYLPQNAISLQMQFGGNASLGCMC